MVRPIPTPAHYIDEVVSVQASGDVRAIIELGSCGIPVRLTLSMHDAMKLGRAATKVANELFAQQRDNVVAFQQPKRRRAK